MGYSDYWDYAPDTRPFTHYLRPGEGLLWNGRPDPGAYASSGGRAALLFAASLPLLLWACWASRAWYAYPAGLILAALALLAMRRSALITRAERVSYGVTEHRLMIHIRGKRPQLVAYDLVDTPFRHLEEWHDASQRRWSAGSTSDRPPLGTIAFRGLHGWAPWNLACLPDPIALARVPAFAMVRDPLHVMRVIDDARALPSLRSAPESAVLFAMPPENIERA